METWNIYRWTKTEGQGSPMSHGKNEGIWEMSGNCLDGDHIAITKTGQENGLMGDFQGSHICKIYPAYGDLGRQKAEENARLISAAPKMLDALLKCHDYMHDLVAESPDETVGIFKDDELEKAYMTLRAAIASATNDPAIIPSSFVCV